MRQEIRRCFVLDVVDKHGHAFALHVPVEGHEAVKEAGCSGVAQKKGGKNDGFDASYCPTLPGEAKCGVCAAVSEDDRGECSVDVLQTHACGPYVGAAGCELAEAKG